MTEAADLIDAVADLGAVLGRTTFPLPAPSAWPAETDRRELAGQLADYLIPRLRTIDAPLLAVVGGSTGAGKSTLINSLVGDDVSQAGVLRPTTRGPVIVCHPSDLPWFTNDRILPQLPRSSGPDGCAWRRTRESAPASRCSTPRTSTASSAPTASLRPRCWLPPICGFS